MKIEKNYEFREELLTVHKKGVRNFSLTCPETKLSLGNSVAISIEESADDVVKTAARDFVDFLDVSMGIDAAILKRGNNADIVIKSADGIDLKEADGYKGFLIKTSDRIEIFAHDSRGAASALFMLEDLMTFEKAPFVDKGEFYSRPAFSPQMVHSGYGFDEYPDEYLARVAHEGRDAILVYTNGTNLTPTGYLNFNELIDRAKRWGIDVYAYSVMPSEKHPLDEGAEEYYENSYGTLFRNCPGLRGVTLVGESVEFPSRDEHVHRGRYWEHTENGILHGKPSCGFYPSCDWVDFMNLLKKVVRRHKSDADLVLWSYNWGSQPEDARVELIRRLPTDITLLVTFEMFEPRKIGSVTSHCADYTLSFAGPGGYFISEAKAAHERGIKLYAMTNTGGLTWDFGVIPYEPMPYQWIERYEKMREAHDNWNLSGIMECHHFGFYPSFISRLAKWSFAIPRVDLKEILEKILKSEFGEENYEATDKCMHLWSEAIRHYTPTDFDQYGAFRIGPSYPFVFVRKTTIPNCEEAVLRDDPTFGSQICVIERGQEPDRRSSISSVRFPEELKSLERMRELIVEGLCALDSAPTENAALAKLKNLGRFILATTTTGINAKRWFILKNRFFAEPDREKLSQMLDEMETLLKSEIENAKSAIPLVEADSRLGWEPRMIYLTDREHIEWKIAQVEGVLKYEVAAYRDCLEK